jgi:hypothetical protein
MNWNYPHPHEILSQGDDGDVAAHPRGDMQAFAGE